MNYRKWQTAKGIVLNIEDMSDNHISNCIIALKNSQNLNPNANIFESYNFSHLSTIDVINYIKEFKKELKSRKNK